MGMIGYQEVFLYVIFSDNFVIDSIILLCNRSEASYSHHNADIKLELNWIAQHSIYTPSDPYMPALFDTVMNCFNAIFDNGCEYYKGKNVIKNIENIKMFPSLSCHKKVVILFISSKFLKDIPCQYVYK